MGLAKIIFWKYQKNKRGESPIFIRIIEDRKPRYLKTGLLATEQEWDFDDNCFRTKYRKAEEQYKIKDHEKNNEILFKKLRDANNLIKSFMEDDNIVSSEQLKFEIINAKAIGKQSVLGFIDGIIEEKKRNGNLGTAKCYNDLKNSLKSFIKKQGKKEIAFKEITPAFLKKYENDFRERGATGNGISFYMRSLRAIFNRAITDKVCKKDMYPFTAYNISELSTDTVKRAISKDEIEKIKLSEVDVDTQMFRSKSLFLFSYYCRGINFIDIALLKWENINSNRLSYTREKNNKHFNIELLQPAIEILNYYKTYFYRGESSYIFPVLDETRHITPISIKNRLHKVLSQTNKDLKDLGEKVGIKIPLTTYVARHTFATVLRRSGASYSTIKDIMGHSDEQTTQIYIDSIENEALDDACKVLL